MRPFKEAIAYVVFWVFFGVQCFAENEPIAIGKSFISPDKQFSVTVEKQDGDLKVVVRNRKTMVTEGYAVMPNVPQILKWSPDSKAIATVIHLAGGSLGGIIRFTNNGWKQSDIVPPIKGPNTFSVVQIEFNKNLVSYKYRVANEMLNGKKIGFRICNLDVSIKTGDISSIKVIPVDESIFRKLTDYSEM